MFQNASANGQTERSISHKNLRVCSLMYHDVIAPNSNEESGFPGAGAVPYCVTPTDFEQQLSQISKRGYTASESIHTLVSNGNPGGKKILLTFDDGGRSAFTHVARGLASHNWVGHFFIATNFISTRGFMDADEIRDLHQMGHLIGSHMENHPSLPDRRSFQDKCDEWQQSVDKLEAIIDAPVTVGSLPGGLYSKQDVEAAVRAGVDLLFTSECQCRSWECNGARCFGRYAIRSRMSPSYVRAMVSGNPLPRAREYSRWKLAGLVRNHGGAHFTKVRNALITTRAKLLGKKREIPSYEAFALRPEEVEQVKTTESKDPGVKPSIKRPVSDLRSNAIKDGL